MNNIYNEIEILTVTFKSDHIIKNCLSNVSDKFKITVVENSNNLNFKKKIEKKKNIKCILANKNLGFGAAFNLGVKKIKSKFILHINPDVIINNQIIRKLYDEANKIKDLGILAPLELNKKRINSFLKNNSVMKNSHIEVEFVKGFAMLLNNKNCSPTNFFDENIFLYLEEIDLCKRLKKNKKKICVTPNIKVKYRGGKSHNPIYSEKMELQRNWHYLWSLFYFLKKHHGLFYAYKKTIRKFFSALIKCSIYFFLNKKKFLIYKYRLLGLLNSYLGKKSSFRILL